jgi:hypothetical protein
VGPPTVLNHNTLHPHSESPSAGSRTAKRTGYGPAPTVIGQVCGLPNLAKGARPATSLARFTRTDPAPAASSFHDAGSTDRMICPPASQRSSRKVAAAILSGTPQPAGRARDRPRETHPHDDAGNGAHNGHDRNLADLLTPCALALGQALQLSARRVHPLHGVHQLPPALLLLGRLRRLANLGGEDVECGA